MWNNETSQKRSLGSLRKANKTKPKSPDCTGPIKLQRHTIETIVKQFEETDADEIIGNLAGWKNQDASGSYLSIELSPRFVSRRQLVSSNLFDSICHDDVNEEKEEV